MPNVRTLNIDHRRARTRWTAPAAPERVRRRRSAAAAASLLKPMEGFGPNPGALTMLAHAPKGLRRGQPLVVVLHGCSQDARGYDAASGWSRLADELGFAVVFPEQKRSNNPGGCFNWFLPADAARGLGETRSIREMVEHMIKRHGVDRDRVFVTGLSAGGAMTAALLADYPETFSAGAVIAGLPCGAATTVQDALNAMASPRDRPAEQLGDAVRTASPHLGPWPRVMVVHGDKDETVAPANGDALVAQWLDVHGAERSSFEESDAGGHRLRVWAKDGRTIVEQIVVSGMGHGAPLDGSLGERTAPFMLDVGLSSTRRIADFFGIPGAVAAKSAAISSPAQAEAPAAAGPAQSDVPGHLPAMAPWPAAGAVWLRRAAGWSSLSSALARTLKALGVSSR